MTTAKLWLGLFLIACLYFGCSKNNNSSNPSISLKSINANVIPYDTNTSLLSFTFNLSEQKYNPGDTLFVVIDYPKNIPNAPSCTSFSIVDTFQMTSLGSGIPTTTSGSNFKGDMIVSFSNGLYLEENNGYPDIASTNPCSLPGGRIVPDTVYFAFVLGSGSHFSDTVKAGPIVLLNQ